MKHLEEALGTTARLEVIAVVFFGILASGASLEKAAGSQAQKERWPPARAGDLLFKGLYGQAAAEAEKVISEYANDHIIVSQSLDTQARALVLAGRKDQAIEALSAVALRYEKNDSPYSDTYPVPMSLFLRIERAKIEVFSHRRLGEYQQAVEAVARQIGEEKRALAYLQGNEQSKRGQEFLIEAILTSQQGDFCRYAGQYTEAVARYESALQFLARYTTPSDDAGDGKRPPRGSAIPTDKYLKNLLPQLIEQCTGSGPTAQYARNVDFVKEIGDWHRDIGRMYKSQTDHAVARGRYKEALAYLQRQELPADLKPADKKRYSIWRDATLPQLISGEKAATK